MDETLAAAIGVALLFLCVCVYAWSRQDRSSKRMRARAAENYRRDIEADA